ncbi:putative TetR-family transcriptional regulator [Polymorphobacter glacialis]|uniref:TetR-family transcriptional regulator n=1 Tax=Sandarakinorhabdus glacialis TaxID=1614636 RepID=A0A916ZKS8_9SPHN|nr:TetR/AcrR family transcriptional regulator [Polymorphobacter glacialis]GGE02635.1 putative TetR-family transcriptional regulator [Polymorphobacter glacialis]
MASATSKKTYHHGDLRTAAIETGLALLESRKFNDLGLREIARTVGVSATALYRHFPDKDALLSALAAEGRHRLAVAQQQAADKAGGGKAGFSATGAAYVRFALANPALYRLIFIGGSKLGDENGDEAMRLLMQNARMIKGANSHVIAARAWSMAHGLAMLILDGQLPADDTLIDSVIDSHHL